MPYAYLTLPIIVGSGLIFGWMIARWLERQYDRGNQASSEELLDELEMAYSSRHSIELPTSSRQLRGVFGCIVEQIDSGFGEKHARQMVQRVESQGPRNALYPVRVNGVRSELEFQWSRHVDGDVRLVVLAAPKVIRALKRYSKAQPRLTGAEPSPS